MCHISTPHNRQEPHHSTPPTLGELGDTVGQNILRLKSSTYLILQQFDGIMACVVYNCYLWPSSGAVNKQIYRDNNWGAGLTVVC